MFSQEFAFRDCPWCGLRDAQFAVLVSDLKAPRPTADGYDYRFWALLSCPRCAKVVALEHNAPSTSPAIMRDVVPEKPSGPEVAHLPPDVERHYMAADRVLTAGEPDLAAVSLRRTIEAAAHHKGINEKVLVASVEAMVKNGLITTEFRKVLNHVRKVGNVGAHAGSPELGEDEVRRALRFTTQVLRNLFEIPAELAELDAEAVAATAGEEPAPE